MNLFAQSTLSRAERRRRSVNAARRKYWRRKAAEFAALDLTTRGTIRKYRQHHLPIVLSAREKRRLRQRFYRSQLAASGFTIRGRSRWTPKERAWRVFRAGLVLPIVDIPLRARDRMEVEA